MAKDPWNRYQRGKDMALALYQLKAQLEERRSQDDLGTMISAAAESVPTLKIANLKAIAESGGPDREETPAAIPAVGAPAAAEASAPRRGEGSGSFSQSGSRRTTEPAPEAPPVLPPEVEPTVATSTSPGRSAPTMPVRPISARQPAKKRGGLGLGVGIAVVAALAIAGYFALRPKPEAAPPAAAPADTAPINADAVATQKSVEEGKRLYDEGKYAESLVVLRNVLGRDPNNAEARRLSDGAENALKARTEQAGRAAQIAAALDLARESFSSKKWQEARDRADAVLVLDSSNADATKLRQDAVAQIDKAAAEKKKVEAQLAKIRAMPKNAPQTVQNVQPMGPVAAPSAPAAASNATLRLLFDSPISEGHVMVAINDQILLRRPYNFKKKSGLFKSVEGTGTVSANIPVPTGPVTVKVWLSGPGISPAFGTATASMLPSETRTLKVDYGSGQLGVRVQ
jgi:hypothetical protein